MSRAGRAALFVGLVLAIGACGGSEAPEGAADGAPEEARMATVPDTLAWRIRTVERTSEGCADVGADPDAVTDLPPCADVLLSWPELTAAPTPAARERIRAWTDTVLLSPLWEDGPPAPAPEAWADAFFDEFEAFLADGPTTAPGWAVERVVEVVYEDPAVVSLRMDEYTFTGGAHPNSASALASFDPVTGRRLALADLFGPGFEVPLLELAERGFREARGLGPEVSLEDAGFWFEEGIELAQAWAVVEEGLLLRWDPYEVAPYAAGPTEVLLTREGLAEFVSPEGPLGR